MALTLTIGVHKTQVFHTHLYGPRVVSIYVGGDATDPTPTSTPTPTTDAKPINEVNGVGGEGERESEGAKGYLLFEKEFDIIPEKGWDVWKKSRDAFNRLSKADQAKCCVAATRG